MLYLQLTVLWAVIAVSIGILCIAFSPTLVGQVRALRASVSPWTVRIGLLALSAAVLVSTPACSSMLA